MSERVVETLVIRDGNNSEFDDGMRTRHDGAWETTDTFSTLFNSVSNSVINCRKWTRRWLIDFLILSAIVAYVVFIIYTILYDKSVAYWTVIDAAIILLFSFRRFTGLQDFVKSIIAPTRFRIFLRRSFRTKAKTRRILRRCLTIVVFLLILIFLAVDLRADTERLVSLGGLCLLIFLVFITSKSPTKVCWTPVLWGLILQFTWGVLILRWQPGFEICKFIGDGVSGFLGFADEGSKFVFDEKNYTMHVVAFKILPVVVYFSAVVSILYYLGVMQFIINGLAKLFQYTMKTTAIESFATAAHIFIGQVESSIALKPFFSDLTLSELNAVMTSGFATVAGTVIAAYIEFGVPPEHVISASFMSAPAALAVAKLGWPETKLTTDKEREVVLTEVGQELNIMEAASAGAVGSIKLISYVIVNLIAFIALLAFVNYFFSFMGARVGHPEFTFEYLCSYVFMPLALVMGVRWQDCDKVARLIGKKIFINEFLSYADLGHMIENNELDNRSAVITTYILCGFGSIAAMGINLGALTAAAPSRRKDYANGMLRAMIGGNVASFMTACVAGMLYRESSFLTNTTAVNATAVNATLYDVVIKRECEGGQKRSESSQGIEIGRECEGGQKKSKSSQGLEIERECEGGQKRSESSQGLEIKRDSAGGQKRSESSQGLEIKRESEGGQKRSESSQELEIKSECEGGQKRSESGQELEIKRECEGGQKRSESSQELEIKSECEGGQKRSESSQELEIKRECEGGQKRSESSQRLEV
ncbi:sodium/nucleoside cotransporter 1-like [Ylistrum balloti]|uniref:sodium/nucleoside cotransporter 1-like n=1 Tax=Ylistrum balloti TaxID=509963 RepID=UPI002905EDEE|nr:sodium/nucleoside cotransporter 1-like [Ylistrum balloti]